MWLLTRRMDRDCESVRDALERSTDQAQAEESVALGTLLSPLAEGARKHITQCSDCRTFADELLKVRRMFESQDAGARPGPYFLARVMAAIHSRMIAAMRS